MRHRCDIAYHLGDVAGEVLATVMPIWRAQGHRVLLFCQTKQMLSVVERFLSRLHHFPAPAAAKAAAATAAGREEGELLDDEDEGEDEGGGRGVSEPYAYVRLDGGTSLAARQGLVDRFNNDDRIFAALLTTRVGGVGINLTGADRVVLVDPDWNPQTDIQARERAWRLGQTKPVTIYRLIVAGTIEEKIYHRQIFKTQLSSNVLQASDTEGAGSFGAKNRLFSSHELKELFTLTLEDDAEEGNLTTDVVPHGALHKPAAASSGSSAFSSSRSSGKRRLRPAGGEDTWESQVARRRRLRQQAQQAEQGGRNGRGGQGGRRASSASIQPLEDTEQEDTQGGGENLVLQSLWTGAISGAFSHDVLDTSTPSGGLGGQGEERSGKESEEARRREARCKRVMASAKRLLDERNGRQGGGAGDAGADAGAAAPPLTAAQVAGSGGVEGRDGVDTEAAHMQSRFGLSASSSSSSAAPSSSAALFSSFAGGFSGGLSGGFSGGVGGAGTGGGLVGGLAGGQGRSSAHLLGQLQHRNTPGLGTGTGDSPGAGAGAGAGAASSGSTGASSGSTGGGGGSGAAARTSTETGTSGEANADSGDAEWCAELMQELQGWLQRHQAPSSRRILRRFSHVGEDKAAFFRACLRAVADCVNGRWYLKPGENQGAGGGAGDAP